MHPNKKPEVYEFTNEFYGGGNKVSFSMIDCNNEIDCEFRKYLETNDAQTLLKYLRNIYAIRVSYQLTSSTACSSEKGCA